MSKTRPLLPDVGLLALPYHRFGLRWMTPHHVLTRLSSYFHVVWLEPSYQWRDTMQVWGRRRELAELSPSLPPHFDLYPPAAWLPQVFKPAPVGRAITEMRIRRAYRRLKDRGCTTQILHLWHHHFEQALSVGEPQLSVYHIDDEYSFLPEPGPMDPAERRVLQKVDQVFAISPALMERKGGLNEHMAFAPEGVDYPLYSTPVPPPADIAAIPHPRVGYTGQLKEQLDWPLLHALASRHSDWSFVFVGPKKVTGPLLEILEEMSRMPNVHFLGPKTVWDLAAYPQHFDVCLMPYAITGYTNNIYPLKLHEYLAGGRPVVGARIRSLLDFGHVIALPATPDEWSAAVAAALMPASTSREAAAARREVARQYDWSEIVYGIARIICERLGPTFTERLHHSRSEGAPRRESATSTI